MEPASLPVPAQRQSWLARLVGNPWAWVIFIGLGMALHLGRAMRVELPPAPPVLSTVPRFELVNEQGQPFDSDSLKGRVWIANFIFTRCPTICPISTARLAKVMHRTRNLGEAFHILSFTVDPEHDTPAVLKAFAQQHRVSPRIRTFLTGPRETLKTALVDGLKVHMEKGGDPDDLMSIGHSGHFVLVDAQMRIRGYYDSSEEASVDALVRDAGLLANTASYGS